MSMKRYYFGLAATLHDSALAILDPSGRVVFAEATERYLQNKRAYNAPPDDMLRIARLVKEHCEPGAEIVAGISWSADYLAALQRHTLRTLPLAHSFDRSDAGSWPVPDLEALALAQRNSLGQAGLNLISSRTVPNTVHVRYYDHHLTHAANAIYSSPNPDCVVAVIDGFGERNACAFFHSQSRRLTPLLRGCEPLRGVPASLGSFYGRVSALCGFDAIAGEEWKVMGLAAYGAYDPALYELLRPIVCAEGLHLFTGCTDDDLHERTRTLRLRISERAASPLGAASLARTGQIIFEEVMTELLCNLLGSGVSDRLALSGGCALNSSFIGQIKRRVGFTSVHVPSAPADDGNALGAAFLAYAEDHPYPAVLPNCASPYLGSTVASDAIDRLVTYGGPSRWRHVGSGIQNEVAELLADGKIVGWVQGRAEFGPRALGNRSILADPRRPEMRDRINRTVKFREEFRPFAPSILAEHGPEYFEEYQATPYMERALRFRPEVRHRVPAVVHVDGTGRLQTVTRDFNPRFYELIHAFHKLTGVPLLLNTSLNVMGKPIAHSAEDVIAIFFTSGLDALAIDDWLLLK